MIWPAMAELLTPSPTHPRAKTAAFFAACWVGLLVLLLLHNGALFTHVVYEPGDYAANSILTLQAKHFAVLTGHYSRVGFFHPGPAFIYVQAAGEWLLYDRTGIAAAPFNGQVIAIMTLNAALLALALTIVYSWLRSVAAVLAAAGVALVFLAEHTLPLISNTWMPFVCFAPFLLYLFAVASVTAGRLGHLWIMVLAGSLLVHGHAEFLFLVPPLALVALIPHRRQLLTHRRDVLIALGVLAVFLLPIVLNEILHWPGEIPKYLAYGGRKANWPPDAVRYFLQYWGPGPATGAVVLVVLFTVNFVLVRAMATRPGGAPHEYSRQALRVIAIASGLVLVYCWYGVDDLKAPYIGIFSYALPLALLILGAAALVMLSTTRQERWAQWLRAAVAVASLAVGMALASTTQALRNTPEEVAGIPAALDYLAAQAHGRPIVLETRTDPSWIDLVAVLLAATRNGQRACLAQEQWRHVVPAAFTCTNDELAGGARFVVSQVDPVSAATPVLINNNPGPTLHRTAEIIPAN
jgi:hypothetical protein